MAKILYQGHGSLRMTLENGKVVYIDPFAGEGYDMPADLILVTHQHFDHNKTDLPPHAENCFIFDNSDALKGGEYRTLDIYGLHIEPVQAYNKNHPVTECVGYLVSVEGKTVYFAGDTSKTEQMQSLAEKNIDCAFLPADGIYNMDIPEAIECAELIKAKRTFPIHISPARGGKDDKLFDEERAKRFVTESAAIIKPGEVIEI